MIFVMSGKIRISKFVLHHNVSNELIIDEKYELDFNIINVKSSSSDIYIKKSEDNNIRVIVYGDKDNTSVDTNNNELSITSKEKGCIGFCFNTTVAKIEVYIPEDYENEINLDNNYGDIEVAEFLNATIDINADCGDVKVSGAKNVTISNDYGDVILEKAETASINVSAGDIKINTVKNLTAENNYGNIKIDNVNSYLNVKNDCGDIKISNINIDKKSYIEDNYGDIQIGSTNEIYIDAKTDLGDVKINNNYNKSDITLIIKNDCGDIKVSN
jgi:hypothetical protein